MIMNALPLDPERANFIINEIHAFLRTDLRHGNDFLKPPFVVEFFGNPDSGKSSAIKSAYTNLRRHSFHIKKPLEGAEEISDDIPRSSPEFNVATGVYAVNLLMHLYHLHKHDMVIFDRGIFDAYGQMVRWNKKGKLSDEEMRMYQQFFTSQFFAPRMTLGIAMICDPDVAMARDQRSSRTKILGESTNPDAINSMRDATIQTYEELRGRFPLALIDTSHMTLEEVADTVNALLLEKFLETARASKKR
jgi:thymidylate kinase